MSNDSLIERFYGALAAGDGTAAAACYSPRANFSDPVFVDLRGPEVGAMWRMLVARSHDLQIELLAHDADGDSGTARWRARYTFSQTGRPVVNEVRATFKFADGLIVDHRDEFDLHRWARQALGTLGLLFGWSPPVRSAVRKGARAALAQFMASDESAAVDAT